jgi:hypothetical protein
MRAREKNMRHAKIEAPRKIPISANLIGLFFNGSKNSE